MPFNNLNSQLHRSKVHGMLYKGIVINNDDPKHMDRIQCRVPELYDEHLGEVPWIVPVKHCIFGQGSGFGTYGVPPIGAVALIELQNDDPNFPVYVGYLLQDDQLPPEKFQKPGVFGMIDPNGSELCIDTNEKTLNYKHTSGIIFNLAADGTFIVYVPKDHVTQIQGNSIVQVLEDANVHVSGNASLNVNGNLTATIAGDASVSCANGTLEATGDITNTCQNFVVQATNAQIRCPLQCGTISTTYASGVGAGASIHGGIVNVGGQIESNGVVLETHVHQCPDGTTSQPL